MEVGKYANILARLVENPRVTRIYSLSRRASDGTSIDLRQQKAFEKEGLSDELLGNPKVKLLEGDPSLPVFGLPSNLYQEVSSARSD